MSKKSKRKKPGLHPTPEQMEKLMELYEKYSDPNVPEEERPTQQQLSQESGIPQTVISYWFRKFEQQGLKSEDTQELRGPRGPPKDRALAVTERRTTKEAIKGLSERSKAVYEQAINIGNIVVEKYGDLVNVALQSGTKLEDFVAEVFNFYERKEEIEQQLHKQEQELAELRELTDPNYVFKRKSQCILDFSKECLAVAKIGVRINPRQAARALQNDLDRIDQEIEMKKQTKIEANPNG